MISKRITVPLLCLLPLLAVMVLMGALHTPTTNAAPDGTQTVTTLADSGAGSLRQTIADATAGDTVEFNVNGTIVLASQLVIDKDLTINGGDAITISGNNATRVFKVTSGNVTFNNLTIANGNDQSSDCYSSPCGGGIMIESSGVLVTVTNSIIISNNAEFGGGIYNHSWSTLMVNGSRLSNNSSDCCGSGIYNYGTTIVKDSAFSSNYTSYYGGGISNDGTASISHSTFYSNTANAGGGGAVSNSGITTLNNSTLSDNFAKYGGGVSNFGVMAIGDSTITDNRVNTVGGGIRSYSSMDVNVTITNSIISHNMMISGTVTADDLALSWELPDSFVSGGHNLIGTTGAYITAFVDGVNGDQTAVNNPKLYPLANNGGSTLTHALQSDSPALDAGANCGATDQRGIARPQGAACDIGAYEYEVPIIYTDFIFLPVVVK